MATNILLLPQLDGTQTSFAITANSDWVDTLFFTAPGSPATPVVVSGSITAGSNIFTTTSTAGLVPGQAVMCVGFPVGTYIGTILSSSQFSLVNINNNTVNATISDAAAVATCMPIPLDLTGITFEAHLRPAGFFGVGVIAPLALALHSVKITVGSAPLLVNGGTSGALSFAVPQAVLGALQVQQHQLDILAIADGHTINLFQNAPASVLLTQGVTAIF